VCSKQNGRTIPSICGHGKACREEQGVCSRQAAGTKAGNAGVAGVVEQGACEGKASSVGVVRVCMW